MPTEHDLHAESKRKATRIIVQEFEKLALAIRRDREARQLNILGHFMPECDATLLLISGEFTSRDVDALAYAVDASLANSPLALVVNFGDCGGNPALPVREVLEAAQRRAILGIGVYLSGRCWGAPIAACEALPLVVAHPGGRYSMDGQRFVSAEAGEHFGWFSNVNPEQGILATTLAELRRKRS